jgi:hypothetical protein
MRWSKCEEHCRELIRQRKDAIKGIFRTDRDAEAGAALPYKHFKSALHSAGVIYSR